MNKEFKAGQIWETRDGRAQYEIIKIRNDLSYPIMCKPTECKGTLHGWTEEGFFLNKNFEFYGKSNFDLVKLVKDVEEKDAMLEARVVKL